MGSCNHLSHPRAGSVRVGSLFWAARISRLHRPQGSCHTACTDPSLDLVGAPSSPPDLCHGVINVDLGTFELRAQHFWHRRGRVKRKSTGVYGAENIARVLFDCSAQSGPKSRRRLCPNGQWRGRSCGIGAVRGRGPPFKEAATVASRTRETSLRSVQDPRSLTSRDSTT